MALKLNGIGKAITNFKYSIASTNKASAFLTITYIHNTCYGGTINKVRVYEFVTDIRHPDLTTIIQQVNALLFKSQNQKIVIKVDPTRNYIEILNGSNFHQYTGWVL